MENNANSSSILGKVMESQNMGAGRVEPDAAINDLIEKALSDREKDVVQLRHGLSGEAQTLEQIGQRFSITRERVRQIAKQAAQKLTKLKSELEDLKRLDRALRDTVNQSGGFKSHEALTRDYHGLEPNQGQLNYLHFFLEHLSDHLQSVKGTTKDAWQLVGISQKLFEDLVNHVKELLQSKQEPRKAEHLLEDLKALAAFKVWYDDYTQSLSDAAEHDLKDVVEAYLELAPGVEQNPYGEWGLDKWSSIKPRRMGDKIYSVLKRAGEPLHFTKLTEMINQLGFDKRQAHAPTVHNELILDDRFVLIGRGTYALKEWGYREGTVADVLARILREAGTPLARAELIGQVLKERQVKEGTIILALSDRQRFKKNPDGKYSLVEAAPVS